MSNPRHTAHGAHRHNAAATAELPIPHPADLLEADSTAVHGMLEQLDDAIFAAIGGCLDSLSASQRLWSQVVAAFGPGLLEESREQYLRYAIEVSRRYEGIERRDEAGALAALEIIAMLTG